MALVFDRQVTEAASGFELALHPSGDFVAVATTTSPFVKVFPWSTSTGFGSSVTDPATPAAGSSFGVAWSPDGNYLAVAHATTPFVTVYNWTGTGFGTKVADPATLPPGQANTVEWSPDGSILVVGGIGPYLKSWAWSGGWGAFLNNAPSLFGTPQSAKFSPDGAYVVCAITQTPRVHGWNFSGAGFGTKLADPATLPAGAGQDCEFSHDGAYVAIAHSNTPFLTIYNWSAGFGTKLANPATLPTTGDTVAFAPGDTHIVASASQSVDGELREILAWEWSGGFGAITDHPDAQPGNALRDVVIHPNGNVICVSNPTTPTLSGYLPPLVTCPNPFHWPYEWWALAPILDPYDLDPDLVSRLVLMLSERDRAVEDWVNDCRSGHFEHPNSWWAMSHLARDLVPPEHRTLFDHTIMLLTEQDRVIEDRLSQGLGSFAIPRTREILGPLFDLLPLDHWQPLVDLIALLTDRERALEDAYNAAL